MFVIQMLYNELILQSEERVVELSSKVESLQASQASAAKARKAAESRAAEAERHARSLEERLQSAGPLSNGHVEEAPPLRPRSAEPPAMAGPGLLAACHVLTLQRYHCARPWTFQSALPQAAPCARTKILSRKHSNMERSALPPDHII